MSDFKLPDLGENIESGDVVSVLVKEGDAIQAQQDVIEIETDKAVIAVPSDIGGTVTKIHVARGQSVKPGQVILSLQPSAAGSSAPAKAAPGPAKAAAAPAKSPTAAPAKSAPPRKQKPRRRPINRTPLLLKRPLRRKPLWRRANRLLRRSRTTRTVIPRQSLRERPTKKIRSRTRPNRRRRKNRNQRPPPPPARRCAAWRASWRSIYRGFKAPALADGLPATMSLKRSDTPTSRPAQRLNSQPAQPRSDDSYGLIRRETMSKIRKTIAANMVRSATTIPHLTNFDDADITELERLRKESASSYADSGIKLTSLAFVLKAVALALEQHPMLNASVEMESGEIIYKQYINLGVAVDTDRGLIVPVLRGVDELSIPQIAQGVQNLADKVRQSKQSLDDLRGGTFTISNLGAVGGQYSTPIINFPEVAILLVGRSRKMPVVTVDDKIEPRLTMPLSLSYDHRVVDGAAASRFLNEVIGYLESPGRLLLAP